MRDRISRVLVIVLGVQVVLAAAKILWGTVAHVLAVEADGWHSFGDGLGTGVALVGATIARRPPDHDHPYGHRKFELLAAAAIGVTLLIAAGQIARDALAHVAGSTEHQPQIGPALFAMLGITFAANVAVSAFEEREGRRLRSPVLLADARHARSDAWVTGGVMVSAFAATLGVPAIDLLAAAAVALVVAKSGIEVLIANARWLADEAPLDPASVAAVVARVEPAVCVRAVRSRGSPEAVFVELRLGVSEDLRVADGDRVARNLAGAIRAELPTVIDVTVHLEPRTEAPHATKEERPWNESTTAADTAPITVTTKPAATSACATAITGTTSSATTSTTSTRRARTAAPITARPRALVAD